MMIRLYAGGIVQASDGECQGFLGVAAVEHR
jgi:hypothetical protein